MRNRIYRLIQNFLGNASVISDMNLAEYLVDNGVTIPIRCKECKNYEAGYVRRDHGWCKEWGTAVRASGFCHHGERRTDGNY